MPEIRKNFLLFFTMIFAIGCGEDGLQLGFAPPPTSEGAKQAEKNTAENSGNKVKTENEGDFALPSGRQGSAPSAPADGKVNAESKLEEKKQLAPSKEKIEIVAVFADLSGFIPSSAQSQNELSPLLQPLADYACFRFSPDPKTKSDQRLFVERVTRDAGLTISESTDSTFFAISARIVAKLGIYAIDSTLGAARFSAGNLALVCLPEGSANQGAGLAPLPKSFMIFGFGPLNPGFNQISGIHNLIPAIPGVFILTPEAAQVETTQPASSLPLRVKALLEI